MRGRARRGRAAGRPHLPRRVQEDQLTPRRISFRADASAQIGTGHVMRCLTLARALAARGHECRFICRDLPGGLNAQVAAEFPLTLLPAPEPGFAPATGPAHAAWAGVDWARDAAETSAALDSDILVLDHYAFDARWETAVRRPGLRLVALDDLADRPHVCDLLVDPNLGRQSRDYDGLLPDGTERLTGPRHALLRPEFAGTRAPVRQGPPRHLLIAMGGVDLHDATGRVLAALPPGYEVTVVLGAAARHLDKVRAQAAALPFPCRVLSGVSDMATLMARADLAIGAAGGTAWERCALGLPALMLVLAENQTEGTRALEAAGAALDLGRPEAPGLADRLASALERLAQPGALAAMSARAAALCDGRGTDRVAEALLVPLRLRPATLSDAEPVWHWRKSLPASHFRTGPNPPLADHLLWFARALHDPDRLLLIADGIGHLRLDRPGTVSILLAPEARGRGFGPRLLALLEPLARAEGLSHLTAQAALSNPASCALFAGAGYERLDDHDGFARFRRAL